MITLTMVEARTRVQIDPNVIWGTQVLDNGGTRLWLRNGLGLRHVTEAEGTVRSRMVADPSYSPVPEVDTFDRMRRRK